MTEDKYTLPNPPRPGDRVAVEIGGVIYTDTIESIRTTTPTYVPPPRPTRWQHLVRAITPRRWRKQQLWIPPGGTASTVITTIGDGPVYQLGKDILPGKRTTWPEIVAEMANSEPDEPKTND